MPLFLYGYMRVCYDASVIGKPYLINLIPICIMHLMLILWICNVKSLGNSHSYLKYFQSDLISIKLILLAQTFWYHMLISHLILLLFISNSVLNTRGRGCILKNNFKYLKQTEKKKNFFFTQFNLLRIEASSIKS